MDLEKYALVNDMVGGVEYPCEIDQHEKDVCIYLLETFMSYLSEKIYCAGWLMGIEETLWNECHSDVLKFIDAKEKEALMFLSKLCGGWIRWSDSLGEPEFVTVVEWVKQISKKD